MTTPKAKVSGFEENFICPCEIITVRSHGKKIIFELSDDCLMIASLGMTGRFQYKEGPHAHIIFNLDDNSKLYYCDSRNFGGIDVISKDEEKKYFSKIGPCLLTHALNEEISSTEWTRLFKPKLLKRKIYDILMDQSIISGIGNYLQAEILYFSAVHPLRIGNTITADELELIRINAHKVVLLSYANGGFTLQSYISPSGKLGMYPAVVYGKTHDSNGYKVIKQKATAAKGSRSIHFVPQIQVL